MLAILSVRLSGSARGLKQRMRAAVSSLRVAVVGFTVREASTEGVAKSPSVIGCENHPGPKREQDPHENVKTSP